MSLFLQAFLVALAVTIAFIDAHTTQTHIFRPIFIGPLVGVIFVGTAVPPNPTISTAIATAVAILGGGGTDLAVATALPVSFIGQIAETVQNSVINVWFMHRAEHAIEKLDTRGLVMNNIVFTMAMNALLYGVPTFLAVYFGADFVADIIKAIPDKIITGLSVGGNMVGAVGFALLLSSIKNHTMWPFLFLGFFFAAYLQINMVGIALLAVVFAALYYYFKLADEGKE